MKKTILVCGLFLFVGIIFSGCAKENRGEQQPIANQGAIIENQSGDGSGTAINSGTIAGNGADSETSVGTDAGTNTGADSGTADAIDTETDSVDSELTNELGIDISDPNMGITESDLDNIPQ